MNNISIIIPFHRNKKMLYTSLKTLQESLDNESQIEVIIVANNVNPEELRINIDRRKYKVLEFYHNLFYPEAIKEGCQIASGEYLVFADPDIFYCENWLEEMISCYQNHENVGCVGAKLINPNNNRILDFGIGYHNYHTIHFYRGLPYNHQLCSNDITVQGICSALFFMKHTLFEALGGFDNEMPYAYCDNDLCLRIRDMGFSVWGASNSIAYHRGNTDAQNSKYYSFRYLREDCVAAFFHKNINRYNNDYNKYLYNSLKFYNIEFFVKGYIFINLSSVYDWKSYMAEIQSIGFSVLDTCECVVQDRDLYKLDLANIIDMQLITSKTPLIYFVDLFQSIYENSLWFSLRDSHNDIIIDRNANCIPCWHIANYLL